LRSRVQEALERCGKRERLAIALILVERLNVAEAADALGMSPRDVDRVIHLTLARLRRVTPERSRSTCTSLRRAS
jgi:DNA-directed RNA polymerase specialized sigma24 family protein